ncbi:MAG: DUF262 domain-containing protein [Neisseria lactamica]|jgi:hypothetical protein|nr:DUF262 domain-containing protein [Neisseria lactamica]
MSQIKSDKWDIKEVFKQWYCIPNYQRPYVWEKDQIIELLDDIYIACDKDKESDYFLGSLVLKETKNKDYIEYDVLDGQQRLTTLFLLTAVIRDLTDNEQRQNTSHESIFQKGNPDDNIPERLRLIFEIRNDVKEFIDEYIKQKNGTTSITSIKIEDLAQNKSADKSVYNMANAILYMREYLQEKIRKNANFLDKFFPFFRNKVILIYVASQNLDDAFRMFTVLNNRGIKLRNADILKADNLSLVKEKDKQQEYAKNWEKIENYFGDEFDNFLSHLQSILTKQKASLTLLKEFENNIFAKNKLTKGNNFFDFVNKYKKHYEDLFENNGNLELKNLLTLMKVGFESEIWIAPLLRYYNKFGKENLLQFTKKLNNKFVSDWISGLTPTIRIINMNNIIDMIDILDSCDELLNQDCFAINRQEILTFLQTDMYGKRPTRYILLLLNYLYHSHEQPFNTPRVISVEHILPQNPKSDSQWVQDFDNEQREKWTNKLGNLIILSRRKNSSQSNLDFAQKQQKYFKGNVELGRSANIMACKTWKIDDVQKNHNETLAKLKEHFGIVD